MFQLNTDSRELQRQIEYIENHFLDCTNANTCAVYYAAYRNLVQMYIAVTDKPFYNSAVNKNKYVESIGREKIHSISKRKRENFIANQSFHLEAFCAAYFDVADILEDFMDTNYYDEIASQAIPIISEEEGLDILRSFFANVAPSVAPLFEEAYEKKQFYKFPSGSEFIGKEGCVFYNPVEDISNVYFNPRSHSIAFLGTMVHEFGHVKDYADYSQRSSSIQTGIYSYQTSYAEVLSNYYQYKFYDYLLDNGIYTDSVMMELLNEFIYFCEVSDDMLLLAELPREVIKNWTFSYNKQDIFQLIMESQEDKEIEFCDDVSDNHLVDLDSTVQYSYGPLLAVAMLDDDALYQTFLGNRRGYFDGEKLSSIGLSPEAAGKKMVKKCESYFGKYL